MSPVAEGRTFTVPGAATQRLGICGGKRPVSVRTSGTQPGLKVRAHPRTDTLIVDRCEAGRWQRSVRRRARSGRVALPGVLGDYRVRIRRHRHSRAVAVAYLRLVGAGGGAGGTVDIPLTFHVTNRNGSRAACASDGANYDIRAHLVAPRSALTSGQGVTVYLHSIGWTSFYWHFQGGGPTYDYATRMAAAGHASVVYDALDYGDSGKPAPSQTCYGSEADVASQIIAALRRGEYSGSATPKFKRVALASQSIAGLGAEPEAYSFKDADALIVTSWADQGFSQRLMNATQATLASCAQGGDGGSGYASFTAADFKALYFSNADPAVADAAAALRAPIPCGEPQSAFQTIGTNAASLREVTSPVLLVYGRQDAGFSQPSAGEQQKMLYTGTNDLTLDFVDGAGQALALERSAPAFQQLMSDWLSARGF